jgi:hypothetical protein
VSSRACPDWPALMEVVPDLQFRHYSLREAQLPAEAFVKIEGVDLDALSLCCDRDSHVFNPGHTDPRVVAALHGTHWIDVAEVAGR